MPLQSGKECIILEGFGDKICKQIDEKLKSFLDDGGILHEKDSEELILSDSESDQDVVAAPPKRPILISKSIESKDPYSKSQTKSLVPEKISGISIRIFEFEN